MNRRLAVGLANQQLDRQSHREGWLGLALFCGLAAIGGWTVIGWVAPYLRLLVPR